MFDLSIIIPTCNRAEHLKRCLATIRQTVCCSHEIIVIDGASSDGTPQVLADAQKILGDRLKSVRELKREGFVKAANKGFRAATGRNMIWLNDDVRPLPGALDDAVGQIDDARDDIAFLAMFHRVRTQRNVAYEVIQAKQVYRLCHIRGTLYANFPIGRRETYEKLGFFDENFYFYAADPDLSLKAWHAGLKIAPAWGVYLDHDEHADTRRAEDDQRGQSDNEKLFAKWDLPPKNPSRNDFDPKRPCTLRGLRANTLSPSPCTQGEGGGEGSSRRQEKNPHPNPPPEYMERGQEAKTRPVVSFVISTYNRRDALLDTLAQLQIAESRSGISCETFVVDNASTDGTSESVKSQFPAVQLLRQKQNLGPCSKNLALPHARGNVIVFLDDDAYPTPESLGNMLRHFERDPSLGAAIFDVELPDGSHECSAYPAVFIGCGTGFRRQALQQVGGLPEDFFMAAEEYDLSLRLLDAGWNLRRFTDLLVRHQKTPGARFPSRITRLDVRNNLSVITRYFPRQWILPFAWDWMNRYRWIAQSKGWRHQLAFWRGLAEGILRSLRPGHRRPISAPAFEEFAMIDQIRDWMKREIVDRGYRRILFLDVGKNIPAFRLAAQSCGLKIVAIADSRLARPGRKYHGIPVLDDSAARALSFDAAVIANVSPVHVALRSEAWQRSDPRPVLDCFQTAQSIAQAA